MTVPDVGDLPDRLRIAVALAAAGDPSRADLRAPAVAACGRSLIATVVDSLARRRTAGTPRLVLVEGGTPLRATIAGRLWAALARGRRGPEWISVLNAALVLLADHDLAASTFAARVAASVRADPYAVVAAGMGPMTARCTAAPGAGPGT